LKSYFESSVGYKTGYKHAVPPNGQDPYLLPSSLCLHAFYVHVQFSCTNFIQWA